MLTAIHSPRSVLVVDDEPSILRTVTDALVERGLQVEAMGDGAQALAALQRSVYDVVITDLRLPGADGLQVLRAARARSPTCGVVLITAYGNVRTAVQAMQEGAHQYLTKPFDLDELLVHVERICQQQRLRDELAEARQQLRAQQAAGREIISRSLAMQQLLQTALSVAATEANVLILGESGTGKELLARAVHNASARHAGPLVAVNCSAIPEPLAEAELFGAERGAFTGAQERRDGRFLAAHRGTLFLDEIGDLSLSMQAKLLRVVEEGTVQRLGSNVPIPVNVRLLAATHRDLAAMVRDSSFRQDLYFRLNVVALVVPPLRQRVDDIPLLVELFLDRYRKDAQRPPPRIDAAALDLLLQYAWPGNVRQLQNVIQRAVVLSHDGLVTPVQLPVELLERCPAPNEHAPHPAAADQIGVPLAPLREVLAQVEAEHIQRALHLAQGNRAEAARLLGISRKHLWHKLRVPLNAGEPEDTDEA